MTEQELQAFRDRNEERKRLKAAVSRGPWQVGVADDAFHRAPCDGDCRNLYIEEDGTDLTWPCCGLTAADAAFCAAARNDVAEADVDALLAEIVLVRQRFAFALQEAVRVAAAAEPFIGKEWANTLAQEIKRLKALLPAARGEDMSDLNVLLTRLRGPRAAEEADD